ncbi:MAG TPA: hypothetical protein ENI23_14365 [bacterium]|nr:hypothetical protein [bacterium]
MAVLIVILIIAMLVLGKGIGSVQIGSFSEPSEIVPAPVINDKIKGYWSSMGVNLALTDLNDAKEMTDIGINTITFSPALTHTEEGKVSESLGTEAQVKKTINKAHKASIRVMLETTPMNAGAVPPAVTNVKLFQDEMTRVALKYAAIAEEYNVAFFAPIVEPGHHMSIPEADEWLQELLPKLREVYSGPIMWKKQAMHLTELKEWDQDHIMTLGFKMDKAMTNIRMKSTHEHGLTLGLSEYQVSLSEYAGDTEKFSEQGEIALVDSQWHTLRIEMEGNQIRIYIDDELMMERTDDSGPMGGYSISADDMRINRFEITDMEGTTLFNEEFETLNNWNAQSGWVLEEGEIAITSQTGSGLIHDVDYSGYDYIAIDTFKRGKVDTIQEYVDFLEFVVDKTNDQAESDGVPNVIIAEFGGSIEEIIGWPDIDERAKIPLTETELAQVTQMVLEMSEDKVDGHMYNGWSIKGQGLDKMPEIKEVIRKWYTSH